MIKIFDFQKVLHGVLYAPFDDLIEACLTKKAFINMADYCIIYDAVAKAGFDNTYAPIHVYGGITVVVDSAVTKGSVIMATQEDFEIYKILLKDPFIQNKENFTIDNYNALIANFRAMVKGELLLVNFDPEIKPTMYKFRLQPNSTYERQGVLIKNTTDKYFVVNTDGSFDMI